MDALEEWDRQLYAEGKAMLGDPARIRATHPAAAVPPRNSRPRRAGLPILRADRSAAAPRKSDAQAPIIRRPPHRQTAIQPLAHIRHPACGSGSDSASRLHAHRRAGIPENIAGDFAGRASQARDFVRIRFGCRYRRSSAATNCGVPIVGLGLQGLHRYINKCIRIFRDLSTTNFRRPGVP